MRARTCAALLLLLTSASRESLRGIATVIGQYVPERAEQLNRYASIRTIERLRDLFSDAGFRGVQVDAEIRAFSFASFDDYFAGTEAGAGFAGQEYVRLPLVTRKAVRETMQRSFPDNGSLRPFVVDMEVLVGSGRK